MEEYKQPAQQDQIIDEIEMAVCALDKVERMYGLGRLTYYWHEVEDLRLRHCPEVYRKIKIKGEGATAADWQEANDKATLLVARELGRRDAVEVEARFALEPDNLRDVLYVYSEEFVEELSYGYHQGQFNENQKRRLWNVFDDLDGEWEALCDTIEGRFGEMSQIGAVRFAQSELHRGVEARITGDAAMRTIARLPEMKESLGYRLVELSSHLAANIIIDGDKLDYGDVTRIELGRYTFEDVYGDCACEADQGSCCDKAGWLFYIKDNGNKHMAINKFLVDFNSEKFDELADLSERYQRFWTLVHSGKVDEALEIDLPYEDDKREMGGIVGKLYKAIADIKLFARDSLDDFGALRDEALQQFRWSSFGSVLYNCFDVMTCDYYRNLGYISGTDSKYGVIREPLDFFNETGWLIDGPCRL